MLDLVPDIHVLERVFSSFVDYHYEFNLKKKKTTTTLSSLLFK